MKAVKGFEGLYGITEEGKVWSFYTNKFIKHSILNTGYPMVTLWDGKKSYGRTLHRLVAEAYLPEIEGKPHVNHKDSDRMNPHLDNLEWCNRSENMKHGLKSGNFDGKLSRNGTQNGNAKLNPSIVKAIRREVGLTYKEIATKYNISISTSWRVTTGISWGDEAKGIR